jgi:hypothetical protein
MEAGCENKKNTFNWLGIKQWEFVNTMMKLPVKCKPGIS